MNARLFSVPAFRFAVNTAIGKWSRFATFGPKAKDGAEMVFDATSLGGMVENAAKRGDPIAICADHASAYPETKDAPALGFFHALAVVADGRVVKHWALDDKPAPDASGMNDGLWGRLGEVTPRGADPLRGLANYRSLSPLFSESAQDETGAAIGYALYDVAATNTPFQAGTALSFAMEPVRKMAMAPLLDCSHCGQRLADADHDGKLPNHNGPDGKPCPGSEKPPREGATTMAMIPTGHSAICRICGTRQEIEVPEDRRTDRPTYPYHQNPLTGRPCWASNKTREEVNASPDAQFSAAPPRQEAAQMGATKMSASVGSQVYVEQEGWCTVVADLGEAGTYHKDRDGQIVKDRKYRVRRADGTEVVTAMSAAPAAPVKMGIFPGTRVRYRLDGRDKTGVVAIVGIDEHLIHADGGGDDLVPARDVQSMSATPAARRFAKETPMDETQMAARFGWAPEDDDKAKLAKVMARLTEEAAAPAPVEPPPGDKPPVEMDVDPSNKEQNAAIHIKTGNVHDEGGRKASADVSTAVKFAAMEAELKILRADKAVRDKDAADAKEAEIQTFASQAVAAGYPEASKSALLKFARVDFDGAMASVSALMGRNGLTSRIVNPGRDSRATAPITGEVKAGRMTLAFGQGLAHAIKMARSADPKLSYEAAAAKVASEHPELVDAYHRGVAQ